MLVKLIGNKKIIKMNLPETIEGNYWVCDNYDGEEQRIINIKSLNNNWIATSNKYSKIINEKAVKKNKNGELYIGSSIGTVIKEVGLKYYEKTIISVRNSDNLYVLYYYPLYEKNIKTYSIVEDEIMIGAGKDNDVILIDNFVKDLQARIFRRNGKWYIENYDTVFGTFINDRYIEENKATVIENGDLVSFFGIKIMILNNKLNIMGALETIVLNKNKFKEEKIEHKKREEIKIEDQGNEEIELYKESDFFYISPRIMEKDVEESISIDPPPTKKTNDSSSQAMSAISSLGMVMTTLVSLIIAMITMNSSRIGMITKIATSSCMIFVAISIPILRIVIQRRSKNKKEKTRQHEYRKYINQKIIKINEIMEREGSVLRSNNLIAEQCERIILEKDSELWSRKIDDEDFLNINLGSGNKTIDIGITKEDPPFQMEQDNLSDIYYDVVNESRTIQNVPISISLVEEKIASVIGKNMKSLLEYMKSIVLQIIALQNYRNLKLVFFVRNQDEWDYVRLLPHIWDDSNTVRFFASSRSDVNEISQFLEEEIAERIQNDENNSGEKKFDYKKTGTYYLIITDNYRELQDTRILNTILENDDNLGFSLLCVSTNIAQLPNKCKTFIEINNENSRVFENEGLTTITQDFRVDNFDEFDYSKIIKTMANIPIKHSSSKALTLPTHYNFLEMYNSGNIEQLNIFDRWNSNDSTISLQAQIGIDAQGNPIYLDAHEKYHGPHGLIAGTTGSGKSEFIITYILSLAINYHPDDVTFVLIDYKGGGLAGAFKKQNVQLPHLVGTITNIDTVGLQRSLESIQSELRRRQVKFNEAKDITNESTIDIYKYQKYYHEKVLKEPISHLFIICDEFAELKQQQPDFMAELMSVSRIGRSLGVHLILATQKPAGIVNDQIRSNSKFGVCLKVQDKADSKDIIKRPDAALLKNAGQFYINVGNDEYFALGQSGYTGVQYVPSNVVKKEIDDSVEFISNTGNVIKRIETREKDISKDKKKRGDQLTNIVNYLDDLAKRKNISEKTLWLDPIPDKIYISKLRKKYKVHAEKNIINPIIGEYDDPFNQLQNVLTLNLSEDGNTIIYGSADSGKEELLSAVLYDSMLCHTSDEVQFYIVDYGSETLNMFRDAPNVGDVMVSDDTEKIMRMFKLIKKQIKERKELLFDYNGDYNLYLRTSEKAMPMIVVIINEFGSFLQAFSRQEEEMIKIFKECNKYGIVFILTANSNNEVKNRTSQNFRRKIALQLISGDYTMIFNKARKKKPSNFVGRGLCTLDSDKVYEFQTAKMFIDENIIESVKEFIKKLKKKHKKVAPKIPIVPEIVNIEDVKSQLTNLTKVPIGISTRSIEPHTYNFERDIVSIITASDIDKTAKFITNLINEINLLGNVNVILLDEVELLRLNQDDFVTRFNKMTRRLNENYNKREEKRILYIILGIGRFLESLGKERERFTSNLNGARLAQNCNFIIADDYTKIKACQLDTWYKKYVTPNTGIYIGTGFETQTLWTSNMERKDISSINDTYGYALFKRKTTPIKLLGMKVEDDEDE